MTHPVGSMPCIVAIGRQAVCDSRLVPYGEIFLGYRTPVLAVWSSHFAGGDGPTYYLLLLPCEAVSLDPQAILLLSSRT